MSTTFSSQKSRADDVCDRTHQIARRVAGIRWMYIEGRPCMEILEQLAGAQTTINALAVSLLESQIEEGPESTTERNREGSQRLLVAVGRQRRLT
jgi:DNA-binding FrmR family transcriptional regulator